ncbi:TFIIB-type zinc ribbon-containing protein [Amycolatopsis sp. NPDC023774]|uniref:TFIIB-type zinc ribbon-containing protein n=1 Tax=Amycolatopsis sp. NPDC023774 TaxID=3155015 RepID=UPI003404396A
MGLAASRGGGERFRDQQLTAWDFTADDVLVRCPRCDHCAKVVVVPGTPTTEEVLWAPRRLVCGRCGYVQDVQDRVQIGPARPGIARDPFLQHPLWLQTDFDGYVLWAYNERHLDHLEAYLAARLRERHLTADDQVRQLRMTMIAKLPAWLKGAKNREKILRRIAPMRASLREPPARPDATEQRRV